MATYTAEQKTEWKNKMAKLAGAVKALSDADRETMASKMAITTCEGHVISPFNAIFAQNQTDIALTIIGGYSQWKKAGRQVIPGSHAFGYVYVPMKRKNAPADEKVRFRMVPHFDVSQTEEISAT